MCADPALIPNAVEEALRFDTSVLTWRRVTTRPVRIGEVDIPGGAKLLLALGAANRDPARFDDPDIFDVTRKRAARHISFGHGIRWRLPTRRDSQAARHGRKPKSARGQRQVATSLTRKIQVNERPQRHDGTISTACRQRSVGGMCGHSQCRTSLHKYSGWADAC